MATIQIRDVPEDAYETIRRRARAAGQSIQAYMRDQVVDFAGHPTKEEAWAAVESALAAEDSPGATPAQIIRDLREDPIWRGTGVTPCHSTTGSTSPSPVRFDVPLVTGDERLSKAPGLPCVIELS